MATGRLPDPNTAPLTAKGDLYTYSTVPARLAVGSNGDTLVADSSQTTGLRYNPPVASLANPVINGGMDIWQRGTSFSLAASTAYTNGFTADRWQTATGANQACTIARQTVSDSTNLPNIQYALRYQRNSGQTGTTGLSLVQNFETVNSIPFAGKTVTLTFYARAGANYSATSSLLNVLLTTGTGTDQSAFVNITGSTNIVNQNATLTTSWQRFAYTATVGSTVTQLFTIFTFNPTGTASTNDWYEITGVQIDVGTWTASTAPTFRRSGGTLAGELAACQRYYWRLATGANQSIGNFNNYSASIMQGIIQFPVSMRGTPTLDSATGTDFYKFVRNGGSDTFNSFTLEFPNTTSTNIYNDSQISGTAGHAGIVSVNNASGYVGFSAEL